MKLAPWKSNWLLRMAEKVELMPAPGVTPTEPIWLPEEKKMMPPVGAPSPV